jgi:hypothetical protein
VGLLLTPLRSLRRIRPGKIVFGVRVISLTEPLTDAEWDEKFKAVYISFLAFNMLDTSL